MKKNFKLKIKKKILKYKIFNKKKKNYKKLLKKHKMSYNII